MSSEAQVHSPQSASTTGTLPRGAWIGGAILGLAAAGFAGAMIMPSMDSGAAPSTPAVASKEMSTSPQALPPKSVPQAPAQTTASKAPARNSAAATHAPTAAAGPADAQQAQSVPYGGSTAQAGPGTPVAATQAVVCSTCGVVESVSAEKQQGQGTGIGAVAGGVLGGVVGHQVGGGKGKTAMTVLGAVGGAFAGNEVEKRTRGETVYNVQVRMQDGSTRVFQQAQSMAVGTRVMVDGSKLNVVTGDAATSAQPQLVRTSAQPGSNT